MEVLRLIFVEYTAFRRQNTILKVRLAKARSAERRCNKDVPLFLWWTRFQGLSFSIARLSWMSILSEIPDPLKSSPFRTHNLLCERTRRMDRDLIL